jgi:hypothetical protein
MNVKADSEQIADPAKMFQYSGLVDALRDAQQILVSLNPPTPAPASSVALFNRLRASLIDTLGQEGRNEVEQWTSMVELDTTGEELYMAAVVLARLVDVLHQTPEFLLSQEVREANAREVHAQIERVRPRSEGQPSVLHFGMVNRPDRIV